MSRGDDAQVTVETLRGYREEGTLFAGLTATEASYAALLDAAGIDFLLVGDSLGMTVQGHEGTTPVTVDDMVYHVRAVARGTRRALLMADLPYEGVRDVACALASSARLLEEGGARVVKLEATAEQANIVEALAARGIPVCAHLGLRPQSLAPGERARLHGRDAAERAELIASARTLQEAGADLLLLECMVPEASRAIVSSSSVPVIGIGAGRCHGQVLVLHDILGVSARIPAHARDFLEESGSVAGAVRSYIEAVRTGAFP